MPASGLAVPIQFMPLSCWVRLVKMVKWGPHLITRSHLLVWDDASITIMALHLVFPCIWNSSGGGSNHYWSSSLLLLSDLLTVYSLCFYYVFFFNRLRLFQKLNGAPWYLTFYSLWVGSLCKSFDIKFILWNKFWIYYKLWSNNKITYLVQGLEIVDFSSQLRNYRRPIQDFLNCFNWSINRVV